MANNQLLASDNFASGSLAAGWSAVPGQSVCQVVVGPPNFTEANVVGTVAGQIWTGLTWPNDQISEVTVTMTGSAVATTLIQLHVRNQGGASYSGYRAIIKDSGAWEIDVVTAGTPTSLISGTGLTIGANDVWCFSAFGSVFVLYQNFLRIGYIGDATYTGGSPGYSQQATTSLSTNEVFSWRGYSAVQQDGVWQKQGCVMPANATELAASPSGIAGLSGITFGPAKFLSGNVYGAYFGYGNNTGYAESPDGKIWTRYSGNPVFASSDSIVFQNGGTWYAVAQATQGASIPHLFTSTDGLNFTDQGATNLPSTGYPCGIADVISGKFYLLFGILNGTGGAPNGYLYSAPVGTPLVWTEENSGNPVLPNAFPGSVVRKLTVGGVPTYFEWSTSNQPGQGNATFPNFDPCEAIRWRSTDLLTWTYDSKSIHAAQMSDSLNNTNAGVAVNCVIDVGGKAYMYYQGSPGDSSGPPDYQPMLAIAPVALAQLVTQPETAQQAVATDVFARGAGGLGANWTTPTGISDLKIASSGVVEPSVLNTDCMALYTGASFGSAQFSSVTVLTLSASDYQYLAPVVLGQLGSESGYFLIWDTPIGTQSTDLRIVVKTSGTPTVLLGSFKATLTAGDVLTLASFIGSDGFVTLIAFQNEFQIMQTEDYSNTYTSGLPGIYMYAYDALTDVQISAWAGGNANVIPTYPSVGNGSLLLLGVGQ